MPLKRSQILDRLNAKREDFFRFDRGAVETLVAYRQAMTRLVNLSEGDRASLLANHSSQLGARPLEPMDGTEKGLIRSGLSWQNREESAEWVRDRLRGITTFAVDGSQIYPGKDLSIPVALVQVGWFENPHDPNVPYTKDIAVDIMTPQDLKAGNSGEPVDRRVNMRRFQMETERMVEYMETHPHATDRLVFLDGSLVATFAEAFDLESREFYLECLLTLLRASETYRVPMVAYIDTSYAQDLTTMLQTLFGLPESNTIHDAQLVNFGMQWGDRTPLYRCQRSGILDAYQDQRDRIAFTYLKTTRDNYPARLEIPVWIYEAGLLENVLDWVRAEVIIGGGYPYAIETADQTAVLQASERQTFLALLQEWAEAQGLDLRFSRKMVSKARRR